MSDLEDRYRKVLAQIQRAAKTPVTLVAVSKTQPADAIEALYRLGHRDFGENYVQELIAKAQELAARGCTDIRWHFIGHLQTNKVKQLLPYVHTVHAVDSERLASELAKRWSALGKPPPLPVFIEVNIDQEPSKSGVTPAQAPELARAISQPLQVMGLMCIPAFDRPDEETRAAFKALRELEVQCRSAGSSGHLSMGMSDDFEIAISEGATHVRVGVAIFGPRAKKL